MVDALKSVRDISRICEEEMRESNHMRDITFTLYNLYPKYKRMLFWFYGVNVVQQICTKIQLLVNQYTHLLYWCVCYSYISTMNFYSNYLQIKFAAIQFPVNWSPS